MKRRERNHLWIFGALGFLAAAAAAAALLFLEYEAYRSQLMTAARPLAAQEGADLSELLKKQPNREQVQKAEQWLEEHGYRSIGATVYGREFQKRAFFTVGILLSLYGGFLAALYLAGRREEERWERILRQIGDILDRFRQGRYEREEWERLEEETGFGISGQLESLAGCLQILTERAQKEREETKSLVTDISHQLKTPVAALGTCLEVLDKEELTQGEREEFLLRCRQQFEGLTRLVESLVQISRLETGMIQIHEEPSMIFETLLEAVNRVYLKAEEKQVHMELEAEERLRTLYMLYDRKWMCEAFINILENAVKYSPRDGRITIRMMERSRLLRIEVEDEGIGIPREERHRIFQRFYRGHQKQVRSQPGTGVGLYLTREIILRHRGTITAAAPAHGKGSLFIVQLPYGS